MKTYEKKKFKYDTKDTPDLVFREIKQKADRYFSINHIPRHGNIALIFKVIVLIAIMALSYISILYSHNFIQLLFSYIVFGWSGLIMGINLGHDAAHHCVTGNKKIDKIIFSVVFGIQGLSTWIWQLRHNGSHHIFPNVYDADTDMEITPLIYLDKHQEMHWYHRYQHLYAPFLYMFFSLGWIFFADFMFYSEKKHANITVYKFPPIEYVKLIFVKLVYITVYLVIPIWVTHLPLAIILTAFFLMHFCVSLFLTFTFFISHHVTEVPYVEVRAENLSVPDSWAAHQINTTIDFNPNSKFANFIFGGFNIHIAHHLLPEVSHVHYPKLTRIIKDTLEEHNLPWYKSFSFFDGVRSHLIHLRNIVRNADADVNSGEEHHPTLAHS